MAKLTSENIELILKALESHKVQHSQSAITEIVFSGINMRTGEVSEESNDWRAQAEAKLEQAKLEAKALEEEITLVKATLITMRKELEAEIVADVAKVLEEGWE